jgi:penicillin-binding protein 1B
MAPKSTSRKKRLPKRPKGAIARPKSIYEKIFRVALAGIFFGAIFGAIGLVYLFQQTSRFVQQNIDSLTTRQLSGIYSEPFMVFRGQAFPSNALLRQLERRSYIPTVSEPTSIGEYQLTDSILSVYTREFLQPNGQRRNANKIVYNYKSGEIKNLTEIGRDELILEPVLIASLTNAEERVSSYQTLASMPKYLPEAFLAIEDNRFYDHFGIDPVAIIRAMVVNLQARRVVQGGSTISQQLAKNLFFTSEKSYLRKIKEALAALALERFLSKDKILELYLNEVYFGRDGPVSVHGVTEAANSYFNKTLDQLTLGEAALFAGMVKAPSSYALRKNLPKALERKAVVLKAMLDSEYINQEQYQAALDEKIEVSTTVKHKKLAPHFIYQVQQELGKVIDIETAAASGLSVFTGIDREYQRCAEVAVTTGVENLEKKYPSLLRKNVPLEAALVSIEPYSGLIKAWVGGRDFGKNQFNHVSQANRQIGSTIKPFVYLTALSPEFNNYKVATPVSILADEPMTIDIPGSNNWTPENYDKKFRGDVTLRYALENSLNIPAVYISQKVGINKVANVIESFRIASNVQAVPSLALGATESTLLNLTSAYATLANSGTYVGPRLFSSVLTKDGALAMSIPIEEEKIAQDAPVSVLTNIMQGVVERGTARGIRTGGYQGAVAGKTGTTNDARDAWFIGFTPTLATGVWVGFDDNKKIGLTGGSASVPIWAEYMKCISPYLEDTDFIIPSDVVSVQIDSSTNLQSNPECPANNTYQEVFVRGTEPRMTNCSGDYTEESDQRFEQPLNSDESLAEQVERESRTIRNFWENLFQ